MIALEVNSLEVNCSLKNYRGKFTRVKTQPNTLDVKNASALKVQKQISSRMLLPSNHRAKIFNIGNTSNNLEENKAFTSKLN